MAWFGKALENGMGPLIGKREIMDHMQNSFIVARFGRKIGPVCK